jgi:glycosyltransferase involved in cell wall biosynthesis
MRNYSVIVKYSSKHEPAFHYVAQGISEVLGIPLIRLKTAKEAVALAVRGELDNSIIVGCLNSRILAKIVTLAHLHRVVAYVAVEGPLRIPRLLQERLPRNLVIVTPSNYVKEELGESGITTHMVIPHGIKLSEFKPNDHHKDLSEDKVRVLVVLSSMELRKVLGLHYALYAWKKLSPRVRNKAILTIKIPPGSSRILNRLLFTYRIKHDECEIVEGFLSRHELLRLYSRSHIYFHVTLSDGFGLPILESLASGTPLIALNDQPWNEVLNEEVGWLVNVRKKVLIPGVSPDVFYRIRIPDVNSLIIKLANAIEFHATSNYSWLRTKCRERALHFDIYKTYSRFRELLT